MSIFAIFESTQLHGWEFHSKKITKSSYLLSKNDLGILNWRPNLQPLRLLWQPPNYRLGNSNFEKKINLIFRKIFLKKLQKTSYLENYKNLSSQLVRQNSQLLRVPWQSLITKMIISSFVKFFIPKFSEKKSKKNVISRKLQEFEQPKSEAKFATPESTLTDSNNKIEILNVLEIFKI